MPNVYLLPGLQLAPLSYERIVRSVPPERWDVRTDPSRFSLREAVAHVADWEPILLQRMRVAVSNPGAMIQAYDEGQMALDHGYASSDPLQEIEKFKAARRETVEFLKSEAEGHWDNVVIHEERGPISLNDQANLLLGHDHYHLEHLTLYL